MSNKKISELPAMTEFTGLEKFAVVHSSETKSITGEKIIKPISVTKAALAALISGNTLIPNVVYSITDAQDALGGTVSVTAITTNTIDGNGRWTFNAKLGYAARFAISGAQEVGVPIQRLTAHNYLVFSKGDSTVGKIEFFLEGVLFDHHS